MTTSVRKNWRLQTVALLLTAAFVFDQWAFAQHQADIEKHQPNHQCEWCLVAGHLGHALVNSATWVAGPSSHVYLPETSRVAIAGTARHRYSARAPPATPYI